MNIGTLTDLLYGSPVFLSALLGTAIGLEREIRGKDPSLRTFAFICMGSCMFAMLSRSVVTEHIGDPGRIAAQIVTGVGFLGAGAIFRSPRGVTGLTTAALIWVTAAIGTAVGLNQEELGVVATLYALGFAFVLNLVHELIRYTRKRSRAHARHQHKHQQHSPQHLEEL